MSRLIDLFDDADVKAANWESVKLKSPITTVAVESNRAAIDAELEEIVRSELLPCPFCGCDALDTRSLGGRYMVRCKQCSANIETSHWGRTLQSWNDRTPIVENAAQYRARIVEEACTKLSIESNNIIHPGEFEACDDANRLVLAAKSEVRARLGLNEFYAYGFGWITGVEAEALLRCGWRPDWWGES